MKITIIAPALPPKLDAIGAYTALLAAELARSAEVAVLTELGHEYDPVPGVAVHGAFDPERPESVSRIPSLIAADPPDWLLLQYNPFSYGRWGFNPFLPQAMRAIKRRSPHTRLAVMVHEPFVPFLSSENWKFAIMTVWQRWQLWALGRTADVMFFSIELWAQKFGRWFRGKPVRHLPVGSNVPRVAITRDEARRRLGIAEGTSVLGVFGTAHPARLLPWVRQAAEAVAGEGRDMLILHIGPDADLVRRLMGSLPLRADGPLPAEEVSRRFAAMDVYLIPFADGVSTRRTSLMTSLQHGLATVATVGRSTDSILRNAGGRALLLAPTDAPEEFCRSAVQLAADAPLRGTLGSAAQSLYDDQFDWPRIAAILRGTLEDLPLP